MARTVAQPPAKAKGPDLALAWRDAMVEEELSSENREIERTGTLPVKRRTIGSGSSAWDQFAGCCRLSQPGGKFTPS